MGVRRPSHRINLDNTFVHVHNYNTRYLTRKLHNGKNQRFSSNEDPSPVEKCSFENLQNHSSAMYRQRQQGPQPRSHLNPCSEPELHGPGFLKRYFAGFVIFCAAAVIVSSLRGLGYSHDDLHTDISFIKDQMNSMKVAIVHVQKTKHDMDMLYKEMHRLLNDLSKQDKKLMVKMEITPQEDGTKPAGNSAAGVNEDEPYVCDEACQIAHMIDERVEVAIEKYKADETGMPDYAMESCGGAIESVGSTETFYNRGTEVKIMGFKICSKEKGPEVMLQPSVMPGDCWAFKGHEGNAIIRLVRLVRVTFVSLEHINKSVSPSNELSSAPREFSIYGIYEDDRLSAKVVNKFYGRFSYDINSTSIQYFAMNKTRHAVRKVEVKFHNNHGNEDFTCVYRLRVHGTLEENDDEITDNAVF